MKALVTGCAGFIGSTLVDRLLEFGCAVVGVDSFSPYYEPRTKRANISHAVASEAFTLVEGDLSVMEIAPLLDGVDVVFHFAAQPGVRSSWGAEFGDYLAANILATQRLLEAVRMAPGVSRFVYASSSSVYGEAERYPTEETDREQPRSPYGATKLAGEHLCSLYAATYGVPTVALRFFTVYGPRQRPDMAFHRFIRAAIDGSPITVYGDGEHVREFTHVDDIARASIAAATRNVPPGTIMNLSGGSSASVNDVLDLLRTLHGSDITVTYQSGVAGDVRRTAGATDRARDILDWSPAISLEDGLVTEYAWLRAVTT